LSQVFSRSNDTWWWKDNTDGLRRINERPCMTFCAKCRRMPGLQHAELSAYKNCCQVGTLTYCTVWNFNEIQELVGRMPAAEQSPNAGRVNLGRLEMAHNIHMQCNGIGRERLSRSERINHQAHGLFARSPTSCLSCCVWRPCLPDKDPMSDPPEYPHQMPSCLQMWLLPCSAYQTIQVCPMFPF
jgi:hypothetical protein